MTRVPHPAAPDGPGALLHDVPHGPPVAFVYDRPRSDKVACSACGSRGYPPGDFNPQHWTHGHLRGHMPCPWCGRLLGVTKHGHRQTHTRCPKRPTEERTRP